MKIKIFALSSLGVLCIFAAACADRPIRKQLQLEDKKIVDFENLRDDENRTDYDFLRVQVGEAEQLYRPSPYSPRSGRIIIVPNSGAEPVYVRNEEHTSAFAFDSDELTPLYKEELTEVAHQIMDFGDVRVRAEGYTDSIGREDYNFDLSTRRARAVAYYLVQNGVDASIISYVGNGENAPVATNKTEAGRAQNRRVELFVIKEGE